MARKLKTYQTSLGFFDLAIAAPSMKAALEAWGADSNLFHQGAAKESDDPDVIAATMAKPGVVLRRPVGSDGSFGEHAELPTNLGGGEGTDESRPQVERPLRRRNPPPAPSTRRRSERPLSPTNGSRSAASVNGRGKRPSGRRSANVGSRPSTRRKAALDKAEREHAKRAAAIQTEVEALEKKLRTEDARWNKEKERLEAALRRARD